MIKSNSAKRFKRMLSLRMEESWDKHRTAFTVTGYKSMPLCIGAPMLDQTRVETSQMQHYNEWDKVKVAGAMPVQ